MKTKRFTQYLVLSLIVIVSLACSTVSLPFIGTATSVPTITPIPTNTLQPTTAPTPTAILTGSQRFIHTLLSDGYSLDDYATSLCDRPCKVYTRGSTSFSQVTVYDDGSISLDFQVSVDTKNGHVSINRTILSSILDETYGPEVTEWIVNDLYVSRILSMPNESVHGIVNGYNINMTYFPGVGTVSDSVMISIYK